MSKTPAAPKDSSPVVEKSPVTAAASTAVIEDTEESLLNNFNPDRARQFIRKYQEEKLSYREMVDVYRRNILTPHFQRSNLASLTLILLPAMTNIYYTFRPNSPLVNIMMFGMPLACLLNLGYNINRDINRFVKDVDSKDSNQLLERFRFLYLQKTEGRAYEQIIESTTHRHLTKQKPEPS